MTGTPREHWEIVRRRRRRREAEDSRAFVEMLDAMTWPTAPLAEYPNTEAATALGRSVERAQEQLTAIHRVDHDDDPTEVFELGFWPADARLNRCRQTVESIVRNFGRPSLFGVSGAGQPAPWLRGFSDAADAKKCADVRRARCSHEAGWKV